MYHPLPLEAVSSLATGGAPFVLLDSASPDFANRFSYVFAGPRCIAAARRVEEVPRLLRSIEDYGKKFWVAGYLAYEAAYALEEKLYPLVMKCSLPEGPAGWFGIFAAPYIFDHAKGQWNRPLPCLPKRLPRETGTTRVSLIHTLGSEQYGRTIQRIRRLIARGDVYQVNFTYDVLLKARCGPFELYRLLRENQKAAFCSFISTGRRCIASFSPELFFRRAGGSIMVKPMKGTAPRGRDGREDLAIRRALSLDPKNRSENVMVVDLMRNDLGKISQTGSVRASKLFAVETHRTLHQMTSTVRGTLKPEISLEGIFRAVFPSGSVTGAPKIRSMEIIRSLEEGNRGAYCGAIGFAGPGDNAVFSVPIRTLQSTKRKNAWKYRVGGGIVWDSRPDEEWNECATKCRFLTERPPDFEIFESLLWRNNRLLYLKDHTERMARSARYLGFPLDMRRFADLITTIKFRLNARVSRKVRIFVNKAGTLRWDAEPLSGGEFALTAPAIIANAGVDENEPLLFHKTTYRPWYAEATGMLQKALCFDVVHRNSKGEITEGGRSNIFIRKGGALFTPALRCGLLPGVLRKNLIRRGKCREAVLRLSDLKKADAIYCGNSVRGLVRVLYKNLPST